MFEEFDNVLVIHVNGELDHHNSIHIKRETDEIMKKKNILNVIFDFEKTSFMDSSGIGVIMGRYKNVNAAGGKLGVVNVNKNIEKILLYSGLYKIIVKYESLDKALDNFLGEGM